MTYSLSAKSQRIRNEALKQIRQTHPGTSYEDAENKLDERADELELTLRPYLYTPESFQTKSFIAARNELRSIGRPDILRRFAENLLAIDEKNCEAATQLMQFACHGGDATAANALSYAAHVKGDAKKALRYKTTAAVLGSSEVIFDIAHRAFNGGLDLGSKGTVKPNPVFGAFLLGKVLMDTPTNNSFTSNDESRASNILIDTEDQHAYLSNGHPITCVYYKAVDAAIRYDVRVRKFYNTLTQYDLV